MNPPGEDHEAGSRATRFTVLICTRDRPAILARTVEALARQTYRNFDVIVVVQGDERGPPEARSDEGGLRIRVVHDEGTGVSRARNIGWRLSAGEWAVYLDDDCIPEPDWAAALAQAFDEHPEAWFISGYVGERNAPEGEYLPVTTFRITQEQVRSGRWTRPWHIGFGVCMAVRRSAIEEVGGWDERLGPGAQDFPAADDMDFNYRLLRAGAIAYMTPRVRAFHEQWRTATDLPELYRGYMAAWAGFSMKQLRTGDVVGGLWLWQLGLRDPLKLFASAARRRSRLRFRVARARLRGFLEGTWRGALARW